MRDIFSALELGETNSGAWSDDGGWSKDTSGPVFESVRHMVLTHESRIQAA